MIIIIFVIMVIAAILVGYAFILIGKLEKSDSQKMQEEEIRRKEVIKSLELENQIKTLTVNLEKERDRYGEIKNEVEAIKQRESSSKEEALKLREWGKKSQTETEQLKKEIELMQNDIKKKEKELSEGIVKNKHLDSQLKEATEKLQNLEKENQNITSKLQGLHASSVRLDSDTKSEIERLQKENQKLTTQLSEKNQALKNTVTQSSELEKKLKSTGEKLLALEKENQNITSKLQGLHASSVRLDSDTKSEIERLQKENQKLTTQLSEKNQALKNTVTQSSELEKKLKSTGEKLLALEKENQNITSKLQGLHASSVRLDSDSKIETIAKDFVKDKKATEQIEDNKESIALKEKQRRISISAQQKDEEIGKILVSERLISKDTFDNALKYQEQHGGTITQYLLAFKYIDENTLAQCLSQHFKLPYLPLSAYNISEEAIKAVPADIVERHLVIPVDKIGNTIMVVMPNPLDSRVIDIVEECSGCNIIPFIGLVSEIITALEFYYHVKHHGKKKLPFLVESNAYTGLERRKSVRLVAQLDISFPIQGHYKRCKTKDVSRHGFCFNLDIPLPIGSILPLEIHLPSQISPTPVVALTKVISVSRLKDNIFEIHVLTTKISKKAMKAVIEYAYSKSKEAAT